MTIIIVGCGKVGVALARLLSVEEHNIVMIDTVAQKIQDIVEELDVMGIVGNGSSISVLTEAGMQDADLLIAVTGSDELNLLCCMFAKKAGHCHAIARVRNPAYSHELDFIKEQLGISTIINPELAAAVEISRLLRFPSANKIDTFADGKVRLIKFTIRQEHQLDGVLVQDIPGRMGCDVLICAVERGEEVIIPGGDFLLHTGDEVSMVATQGNAASFFQRIGAQTQPVKSCLIVGGGTIGYYLAKRLLDVGINVRIVELDPHRCEELTELLPKATILQGDGTDRRLLLQEGLPMAEAFVTLTNLDEENILLALFAKKHSDAKLVTKVNRLEFDDIIEGMDIGSVIYPKYMTCDFILQYVRALQNEAGNNVKTLYRILDDRVEALEFTVHEESRVTGVPLTDLPLKKNQLVCCIARGEEIIIPRGRDDIRLGDTVIVVTLEQGLHDVQDILEE